MAETIMDSPYVISLKDGNVLPHDQRVQAEMRYSAALEKALGSAEQVVAAFRAFEAVSDGDEDPGADVATLANSWTQACSKAQQAGAAVLGNDLDVHFEIRLI